MIRPRLPRVASGTRLTTNLVNNIINRTEYAADLLRQYKLVAGTEMYVEPHYDGTRVSYLQPVAGGATPTRPIEPAESYAVLMGGGAIHIPPLFEKSGQFISGDFGISGGFTAYSFYGKRGKFALGHAATGIGPNVAGIVYNGISQFGTKQGSGFYAQYPDSEWTEFWDIDPINYNTIVGSYFGPPDYDYNGLIYNLSSGQFSQFNRPNQDTNGTYLTGIYNGIIIGGQAFGLENSFYYNGSFNFLPNGFFPYGIYEDIIVGNFGDIYKIGTGFIKQISIPELGAVDAYGVYKNFVCGSARFSPRTSYVYNLNDDSYVIIPNTVSNDRAWAIG